MKLPIIGTSYAHGRTAVTARHATNVWFERRGDTEKAPVIATHLPGTQETVALPGILGAFPHSVSTLAYVHTDTTIYRGEPWYGFPQSAPLGFAASGPISLARYGNVLLWVGGGKAFRCDPFLSATPVEIVISGQHPESCAYVGGYYWLYMQSGRLYWSVDAITWDALDFANTEAADDGGFRLRVVGDILVCIGGASIEFWGPTGNPALPYRRLDGTTRAFNCRNGEDQTQIGDRIFLCGRPPGEDAGIFELRDTRLVRISSPDLDRHIVSGGPVSAFRFAGRAIVTVTRLAGGTFWLDPDLGSITGITEASYVGRRHFLSDPNGVFVTTPTGVSVMSPVAANAEHRTIVTDNLVSPDLDRVTIDKVRLDVQADSVSLRASRDGGATWGTSRSKAAAAARGVAGAVQFDRFGTASQFTFEVSAFGPLILSNIIINPRN